MLQELFGILLSFPDKKFIFMIKNIFIEPCDPSSEDALELTRGCFMNLKVFTERVP